LSFDRNIILQTGNTKKNKKQKQMMISQVNFARPWDMSGSAVGNATTIGNNNNSSNCFITGNDHHRLTNAASTLGLAPLQVRANNRLVEFTAHKILIILFLLLREERFLPCDNRREIFTFFFFFFFSKFRMNLIYSVASFDFDAVNYFVKVGRVTAAVEKFFFSAVCQSPMFVGRSPFFFILFFVVICAPLPHR
jgi:hypothetical protein